ncbi:CHAT domain-containing protein [Streptomyces sp. NPDC006261]|uniref:CHAT domain-containing protein n=1 Tax=Streptomyces sp. NPDC006261 TaxID=3156739 RepID=UPI0033B77401
MHEQLLSAVRARLQRIGGAGDFSSAWEPQACRDVQQLTLLLFEAGAEDERNMEVRLLLGRLHWYRYQAVIEDEDQAGQELRSAVEALGECFASDIAGVPEPLLPHLAEAAVPAAVRMLRQVEDSPDPALVEAAEAGWRRIVRATPDGRPVRAEYLAYWAQALHARFEQTEDLADLDAAVAADRETLGATALDAAERADRLFDLGTALDHRFALTGAAADLDEAIDCYSLAVQDTQFEELRRAEALSCLGFALGARYAVTGEVANLDAAVSRYWEALQCTPVGDLRRAGLLSGLGIALEARFEETGSMTDLNAAIVRLAEAAQGLAPDDPQRATTLSGLGTALSARFTATRSMADLNAAIVRLEEAAEGFDAGDPQRAATMFELGRALRTRYAWADDVADLEAAVCRHSEALRETPSNDPDRGARLVELGEAFHRRFRSLGEAKDLDAAVGHHTDAVQATPVDAPERATHLSHLGVVLWERFRVSRQVSDLDAAVDCQLEAVRITPADDPDRSRYLLFLGSSLHARYGARRDARDLDDAIERYRMSLDALPAGDPERPIRLPELGRALEARFEETGALADLDAAISCHREVMDLTRADASGRAARLSDLGSLLRTRHQATGETSDLSAAISAYRDASKSTPHDDPEYAPRLVYLAFALEARFDATGEAADLGEAIRIYQDVAGITPFRHPERGARLVLWGRALVSRYERTGELAELDEGIRRQQEGVQVAPADHFLRGSMLLSLGTALYSRYERTRALPDLDTAIHLQREALKVMEADDPAHTQLLEWLGMTLRARSLRTGTLADADDSVIWNWEAVRATSDSDAEYAGRLSDLGNALVARFTRSGDPADLDEAIRHHQDAVASGLGRSALLVNLGAALYARYKRTLAARDLQAAIEYCRKAVQAGDAEGLDHARLLATLARALWSRYDRYTIINVRDHAERASLLADLETAIDYCREAVRITPTGYPERTDFLSVLGDMLQSRFNRTGEAADREAAVSAWAEAWSTESTLPSNRISAAWNAARLLGPNAPGKAAEAAEAAVRLLPRISSRRLERGDQQNALSRFAGLAGEAAALALADDHGTGNERAVRALRLLEAGRGVLLGQALDVRSDLSDLRSQKPELAARFTRLRDLLDQPSEAPLPGRGEIKARKSRQRASADDRHRLAEEFEATLAEIRGLEGHSSFALPPTAEALMNEASEGPIVVFNVSRHCGDALLLTGDGIAHVELPELAEGHVTRRAKEFQQALLAATGEDKAARKQAQATLVGVTEWLWDAAAGPVLDALGLQGRPADSATDWSRVWWVPGGMLGQLPVHAAGHHSDPAGTARRTVMDRVVSSYTPTVRALSRARELSRRQQAKPRDGIRGLIVAMPTTPDMPNHGRLGFVNEEVAAVQDHLPDSVLLREEDPRDVRPSTASTCTPTREGVLARLPQCSIVHFACHGATHPTDPSKSLLFLHDHTHAPLTVASLAPIQLDSAELAYLSACRTAAIETNKLVDEAIHLASAFQLAGFPQVIGTLWEIDDDTAVTIADAVYSGLRVRPDVVDTRRAAFALHAAVRAVRDMFPRVPSLWAGYLHSGA